MHLVELTRFRQALDGGPRVCVDERLGIASNLLVEVFDVRWKVVGEPLAEIVEQLSGKVTKLLRDVFCVAGTRKDYNHGTLGQRGLLRKRVVCA